MECDMGHDKRVALINGRLEEAEGQRGWRGKTQQTGDKQRDLGGGGERGESWVEQATGIP